APYPAVIMPHGGPWAQDFPGYDEWAQLLAHHGYLVIQPQFRGSVGFGLAHWKAGDKKWGLEMQDDLDDGMAYLVKKGLADENRLAMFGWSYGGYAAFAASMRENNIYKCAVAGAGVSDMSKISADIFDNFFSRKVQGPTVKGVSPIDHVDKVNIPIFVIHGDIDQRVNIYHSRAFVKKLKEFNKDYKYTELKGADHFSNTLFYDHKKIFYSELIDWLDNKCF
ncbi:Prolyl oligopeptidase family protein, partial [hydrothermal vent metagenome]